MVGRGPLAVMMTLRADGQRSWHVSWGNILIRRHDHVPRSVCGLQCRVQLVSGYSFIDCVLTSLPAIKENKHVIFRGYASYLVTYLSAFILAASRKRYVIGCHHSIHACRYKVSHQHSKTGQQLHAVFISLLLRSYSPDSLSLLRSRLRIQWPTSSGHLLRKSSQAL